MKGKDIRDQELNVLQYQALKEAGFWKMEDNCLFFSH